MRSELIVIIVNKYLIYSPTVLRGQKMAGLIGILRINGCGNHLNPKHNKKLLVNHALSFWMGTVHTFQLNSSNSPSSITSKFYAILPTARTHCKVLMLSVSQRWSLSGIMPSINSMKHSNEELIKKILLEFSEKIGRAHVWTPVTPENLVCRRNTVIILRTGLGCSSGKVAFVEVTSLGFVCSAEMTVGS